MSNESERRKLTASRIRLAQLAAAQADTARLKLLIVDALGYGGEFPIRPEGAPPYFWRTWLFERSGLMREECEFIYAARATKESK